MGSEDLFHKKRERKSSDFKRKTSSPNNPVKQIQTRVLIVCEDSKSSVFYLEEIKKDFDLKALVIRGKECGSAPSSVLAYAEKVFSESKNEPYDRIYCVFDRDTHDCYEVTISKINQLQALKKPFFAITTTPCFEFWLLLHFQYTSKSYCATQNKSSCDIANVDLKTEWADYEKTKRDIYAHVRERTADAIANAKQLVLHNISSASTNPQTNMHELIEYLQSIKR